MLSDFPEITPTAMDFYCSTTEADAYGEQVKVWGDTPNATVDMALRKLSGGKRYVSHIHGYNADHRGYCDGAPDIKAGDRAIDPDGNRYEVKYVNDPMGLSEFLQVDMEWVTNDGNNGDTEGS
jgi:hypothetical protein